MHLVSCFAVFLVAICAAAQQSTSPSDLQISDQQNPPTNQQSNPADSQQDSPTQQQSSSQIKVMSVDPLSVNSAEATRVVLQGENLDKFSQVVAQPSRVSHNCDTASFPCPQVIVQARSADTLASRIDHSGPKDTRWQLCSYNDASIRVSAWCVCQERLLECRTTCTLYFVFTG